MNQPFREKTSVGRALTKYMMFGGGEQCYNLRVWPETPPSTEGDYGT
jgi:hypothetical protein